MSDDATLAEAVRRVCLDAALAAYEQAGISGLCAEGRWECALDAIKSVDLEALMRQMTSEKTSDSPRDRGR